MDPGKSLTIPCGRVKSISKKEKEYIGCRMHENIHFSQKLFVRVILQGVNAHCYDIGLY